MRDDVLMASIDSTANQKRSSRYVLNAKRIACSIRMEYIRNRC